MTPLGIVAAVVLGALGLLSYGQINRKSGSNEMSNRIVVLRTAVLIVFFEAALFVATGPPTSPMDIALIAGGAVVLATVLALWQASAVRITRRCIVEAWKDGEDLPSGITADDVQRWAERHPKRSI